MQNVKLKSKELCKIEFLIPCGDKAEFKDLCQRNSLGMAEVMKRAFEEKLEWLKLKIKN